MTTAEPPSNRPSARERAYNLAARVFGDKSDLPSNGQPGGPSNGDANDARPYNLAERVHGNGAAVRGNVDAGDADGSPSPNVSNGRGGNDAAPYNLAERVYGNGSNAAVAPATAQPATAQPAIPQPTIVQPATVQPATAQPAMAPPRGRGAPPTAAPAVEEPSGSRFFVRTFESLKIPAFRWYFVAQFGTWGAMNMQMVVNGYLVFVLTGSFAALGLSALARSLPGIVLALVGGVLADRMPKKYLIQAGQLVSAFVALAVAILLAFDMLRFEHLLISSLLQGAAMSLMMPARQSMLPGLVGIARIQNAQALGMGVMNLMRMVGPAVGGLMLATTGAEWVYFLMTGLYLFAVVAYIKVPHVEQLPPDPDAPARTTPLPARGSPMRDVIDGVKYVVRERTIGMLLAVNLAIVLVSMPYQMMLPGYVIEILKSGPETLGMLQSIAGIGSLAAVLVIASMPSRHRGLVLLLGAFVMGVALLGFSFSTSVLITAPIMIVISIGQTFRMSLSSVLLQVYVDDAYRGRVMSLFMMEMSMVSLSTFLAGMIAAAVGPQIAIGGMAVVLIVLAVGITLFVPRLRRLD